MGSGGPPSSSFDAKCVIQNDYNIATQYTSRLQYLSLIRKQALEVLTSLILIENNHLKFLTQKAPHFPFLKKKKNVRHLQFSSSLL